MDDIMTRLLADNGGVLSRRQHRELGGSIDWWLRRERLVPVLPGVYAVPDLADLPLTKMRAACLAHPDAVLTGAAAARASYWPGAPMSQIDVAAPTKLASAGQLHFHRRRIPPELVVTSPLLRCTAPALTAIDVATLEDANAVDVALRTRCASLDQMYDALRATPYRKGNLARLQVLLDSRDEPWSEAERRAHRLLRSAGVTGWQANLPVALGGATYYLDIAFRRQRLAVEIDGRLHELDSQLFESDRWRQNALVQHGWRVLRFTWSMLVNHPDHFVEEVVVALRNDPEMVRLRSIPRQRAR